MSKVGRRKNESKAQLRRTHSGNFSVEQAVPLDTLLEEPMLLKKYLVSTKEETFEG